MNPLSQYHRERLLPAVDAASRATVGKYAAYQLGTDEFLGTFEAHDDALRERLKARGYSYNGLSALKWHPLRGSQHDIGSYRRVPERHPDLSDEPSIVTDWRPEQCQFHMHLFEGKPGVTQVYAHYELRPDLFRPEFNLKRKRIHYRPDRGGGYGEVYLRGLMDPRLDDIIQ